MFKAKNRESDLPQEPAAASTSQARPTASIKFLHADGLVFNALRVQGRPLDITFVISYGNVAQTQVGFECFIAWINANKDIIHSLTFVDTAFLGRHVDPSFAQYQDTTRLTPWLEANREILDKVQVPYIIKYWPDYLKGQFLENRQKIQLAFAGDDKTRCDSDFREIVLQEAAAHQDLGSVEYILEECAQYPALNGAIILYPGKGSMAMKYAAEKIFGLNITRLFYNVPLLERRKRKEKKQAKEIPLKIQALTYLDFTVSLVKKMSPPEREEILGKFLAAFSIFAEPSSKMVLTLTLQRSESPYVQPVTSQPS